MAFNKADVIASAKKYGPKYAGKISMFINKNRTCLLYTSPSPRD